MELWNSRCESSNSVLSLERQRDKILRGHDASLAGAKAMRIVDECAKLSISVISIADQEYPERLREIKDAPPLLYVRGTLSSLKMKACAVVGTRQSSDAGEQIAKRIAALLAELSVATVSGLALGIDAAAHRGALGANGVTIAILAHGLHTVAPTTNRAIADELLARGGALISEHEPGVPPRPAEFVRRNRIQSGMSYCSIVVESGTVGGAIHQARFTKDQGRALFVALPDLSSMPHLRFNDEGGSFLVKEMGAIPIARAEDLRAHLDQLFQTPRGNVSSHPRLGL